MPKDYIIEQLKDCFGDRESFNREELYNFYRRVAPKLNESTFRWRIYDLKAKKIIRAVSKSEFSLSYKPPFRPDIDKKVKDIYMLVEQQYPSLKKAIWSTKWVMEFMLHLPGRYWTIMEVEKDSVESVFYFLKDNRYRDVFLKPAGKEIDMYVSESSQAIIVSPLVTLSPVQKIKKITIPRLEKLLLDIYADRELFNVFQGSELSIIFNNAYNKYQINFSKLMSYAKRRGKEEELMEFISSRTDIPNTLFNY